LHEFIHSFRIFIKRLFKKNAQARNQSIFVLLPAKTTADTAATEVSLGPSIKYVPLGGVREGVTVCDRRRGPRACDVTLL